ncbi:MAG: sugar phosphate isomerase/epimerase [Candidatus Sumerlaeota bacterium]|nr:sugar phosphate isomerase/epimerase [Candidatus Sumerlaeota bacterium]
MKFGLAGDSLGAHRKKGMLPTAADWLRKTKELGYQGIMISVQTLPLDDKAALKDLKALADELGLYVELRLGRPLIEKAVDEGKADRIFGAAKLFGGKVLASMLENCFLREQQKWDAPRIDENIKGLGKSLRRIAKVARDYDLPVGFENHIDYRTDEIERILHEVDSPFIGILYDTANQLFLAEDPVDSCRRLASRIVAVHFKDGYVIDDPVGVQIVWCVPGEGIVDLDKITDILVGTGREMNLNLELIAPQVLPITIKTEEFWTILGRPRDDNSPGMKLFKAGVAVPHTLPPTDPDEQVRFEAQELKRSVAPMRRFTKQ